MTKEKASAELAISGNRAESTGGGFEAHPQDTIDSAELQSSNERSEIHIQMTRAQLTCLIGLRRRLGNKRLRKVMNRLGFIGPAAGLNTVQASRLIGELRREVEGRR